MSPSRKGKLMMENMALRFQFPVTQDNFNLAWENMHSKVFILNLQLSESEAQIILQQFGRNSYPSYIN